MFSKSLVRLLITFSFAISLACCPIAFGLQPAGPSGLASPSGTALNGSDGSAGQFVMPFVDPVSGQSYARYIIRETVPDVGYSYQTVEERIFVPTTKTENKTVTETQMVPIYSQQLQLRNVPSWNPFVQPRQVWQYVPIVQYQPNYVQVTRPMTYQVFEERVVPKQIPVLRPQSREVERYVDRPTGPLAGGDNTVANNTVANNSLSNQNFYQQNAQLAQLNRNTSRLATRPIGYPYNPAYQSAPNLNLVAQAPPAYYPNNFAPNSSVAPGYTASQPQNIASTSSANIQSTNNNLVLPAIPLRPNFQPNAHNMAGYYGNSSNGSPNYGTAPYGSNPYAATASKPLFSWPKFASSTGSLFSSDLFSNNRNASYVASNTPVAQPFAGAGSTQNSLGFRPITSSYTTPQQNWGMTQADSYRDPVQGGMPATTMR